jgi:lipoprotein-anchoring transpeptidase ErfK/SrfK
MLTRRTFLLALPLFTAGCVATGKMPLPEEPQVDPLQRARYAALEDDGFTVAGVDIAQIDPNYLRQDVLYATTEPVGTVVVDPANYFLYLVQPGGRAMRYGVGVGREGFGWSGTALIQRKAEWPIWTPPAEMIARDPNAAPWAKGMPGGPANPLGARALYLYQDGVDTLYRLHGTSDPRSIGHSLSSGCVRLLNHDIIDLYGRVPVGSRTVVLGTVA